MAGVVAVISVGLGLLVKVGAPDNLCALGKSARLGIPNIAS